MTLTIACKPFNTTLYLTEIQMKTPQVAGLVLGGQRVFQESNPFYGITCPESVLPFSSLYSVFATAIRFLAISKGRFQQDSDNGDTLPLMLKKKSVNYLREHRTELHVAQLLKKSYSEISDKYTDRQWKELFVDMEAGDIAADRPQLYALSKLYEDITIIVYRYANDRLQEISTYNTLTYHGHEVHFRYFDEEKRFEMMVMEPGNVCGKNDLALAEELDQLKEGLYTTMVNFQEQHYKDQQQAIQELEKEGLESERRAQLIERKQNKTDVIQEYSTINELQQQTNKYHQEVVNNYFSQKKLLRGQELTIVLMNLKMKATEDAEAERRKADKSNECVIL